MLDAEIAGGAEPAVVVPGDRTAGTVHRVGIALENIKKDYPTAPSAAGMSCARENVGASEIANILFRQGVKCF
jgi:hypothetical protein